MFSFGRRGASKEKRTSLGEFGDFPANEFRDASVHVLKQLASAVVYAGGDASFRRRVDKLTSHLQKATLAVDFETMAIEMADLRVPFSLTEDPEDNRGLKMLARCIDAAVPVPHALGLNHLVGALMALGKDVSEGDEEENLVARFESQLGAIEEGASFVRRVADVLRLSVAQLVDVIEPLADDAPAVQERLHTIQQRVVDAADVRELEQLRTMLLEATSSLVKDATARAESAGAVREHIEETRAQVEVLEAALENAKAMATTDPLTGLGNRRGLETLIEFYANSTDATGVLAIDIDHFKKVNDTHGHSAGDMVLRHVAHLLGRELRGDDRAFRVGGEELTVMLYGTPLAGSVATAERLRERVERSPVCAEGAQIAVTISIGVASWESGVSFSRVAEKADKALYRAKQEGRNRVVAA